MVQPAFEQDGFPDEILRLAEQLDEAYPLGRRLAAANTDQTASSLARRFAPDVARQRAAAADPTLLPPAPPTPRRSGTASRRLAVPAAIGLVAASVVAGTMLWFGAPKTLSLDTALEGLGPQASSVLSIPVSPPRDGLSTGANGDGKSRTAPLSPGFAVRTGETDRIEGLMAHGRKMIDVGYLAGARAYYSRAAEAGSGEAALAVGATYDPKIIARLDVQGIKPDRAEAAKWYARAAGLGVTDREATLHTLTDDWSREPGLPEPSGLMASADTASGVPVPLRNPKAAPVQVRSAQAVLSDQEEPQRQRLAASGPAATPSVRPQLLASEGQSKPGPLSMLMRAAAGRSAEEEWMEVKTPVNIRKAPSSTAGSDKVALTGTKLRVVGREGNWIRIADPDTAQEGYIYKRFLKESSAP